MADISVITLPNGQTYNLKDASAVKTVATQSANGLMSADDKKKLDEMSGGGSGVKLVRWT